MSPTRASVQGDMVTVGLSATRISDSEVPCRQITIRSHEETDEMSIGHSDVTPGHRFGFVSDGEEFTLGPFPAGMGLRPCDIYVIGTPGDKLTWVGEDA